MSQRKTIRLYPNQIVSLLKLHAPVNTLKMIKNKILFFGSIAIVRKNIFCSIRSWKELRPNLAYKKLSEIFE
ncbi:hypothetical protein BME96_10810 [Virgibacillus halodenitrificans]|uniref:Uncharacterized protein n=1 Tax=Virgibacillus halodenitrificans TaxID=1482 RepID=A0AAC9J006_VIRHA|nr:hypothetical protein BME96_10810 [Virgibacillus halodenitrificans]